MSAKHQRLFNLLTGFECACRGERHLRSVGGNQPPVFLRDLAVSAVNGIDRVSVDKLERHGIVAGVFQIVFLAVKAGAVAEIAREADPTVSLRLDFERHSLPQPSFTQVLGPLPGK